MTGSAWVFAAQLEAFQAVVVDNVRVFVTECEWRNVQSLKVSLHVSPAGVACTSQYIVEWCRQSPLRLCSCLHAGLYTRIIAVPWPALLLLVSLQLYTSLA